MSEPVPIDPEDRISQLVDEFQTLWRAERSPTIEACLELITASHREPLLLKLVITELKLRSEAGEHVALTDYEERFPGIERMVVKELTSRLGPTGPQPAPAPFREIMQGITPQRSVELILSVCDALETTPAGKLFDLRPDQMGLASDGKRVVLRIVDGIDQPIHPYMAPEQLRGETHRLDAAHIWGMGVLLYEFLSGQPPFRGDEEQLTDAIKHRDPRPLRQTLPTVSHELSRICSKCLAKRPTQRYSSTSALRDDLQRWLDDPTDSTGNDTMDPRQFIPRGLRSYEAEDAAFFLDMLPGARDRDGLPESVAFWKRWIEDRQSDSQFSVGVIYGPSGCGKSSFMNAAVLPQLNAEVLPICIEATASDTEVRLMQELRRNCPELDERSTGAEAALPELVAQLRQQKGSRGQSVLLILDQFEQWLDGHSHTEETQLLHALRQCDGVYVRCILMLRDDFWMSLTEFLRMLEVPQWEGRNVSALDLFGPAHARKVLQKLGCAYGALPAGPLSGEQQAFIQDAIDGLANDGVVICVQLAVFAQMMSKRPWTPQGLREVGGAVGVGETFLEESIVGDKHAEAARLVLEAMLPKYGSNIRAKMTSYEVLRETAGYQHRGSEFDELLELLSHKLCLTTATQPDAISKDAPVVGSHYQLTHDFLVPSLRSWLNRKLRETRKGRAELMLDEHAAMWNAHPENRRLPTVWDWVLIQRLTDKASWTEPQRRMMRKANQVHGVSTFGVLSVLAVCLCVGLFFWSTLEHQKRLAESAEMVNGLLRADTAHLGRLMSELDERRTYVEEKLLAAYRESHDASREKLHAAIALLPGHEPVEPYLRQRLLKLPVDQFLGVRDRLLAHDAGIVANYWRTVQDEKQSDAVRFHAAAVLAQLDSESKLWREPAIGSMIARNLSSLRLEDFSTRLEDFRAVKSPLVQPLIAVYHGEGDTVERDLAATALVEYVEDPAALFPLAVAGDVDQFRRVSRALAAHPTVIAPLARQLLAERSRSNASDEVKDELASRQAKAAILLLNDEAGFWPVVEHNSEPRVRSFVIHWLASHGASVEKLIARWAVERDDTAKRAILQALGEFQLAGAARDQSMEIAANTFVQSPDAGLHSSAEWLLRRLDQSQLLRQLESQLRRQQLNGTLPEKCWYVNSQGQTFSIVDAGEFLMGSPVSEPNRPADEAQHLRRIDRTFAIGVKEVTRAEWRAFSNANRRVWQADDPKTMGYILSDDAPMAGMDWHEAAAYCNWLSKLEGLPQEQWCYEEAGRVLRAKRDYVELTGYRLPTEAEWEYACRAETITPRYYGSADTLLDKYAWYNHFDNKKHSYPVGQLKPNDFGLFDMLGNVYEWTSSDYEPYPTDSTASDTKPGAGAERVLRGGAVSGLPRVCRAAYRKRGAHSGQRSRGRTNGMRLARTIQ